jgi:hypothetical protein
VGVKPGWARVNFHFLMSDAEFDFLCEAILFVAEQGRFFLPLYEFELSTGGWRHRSFAQPETRFGLEEALEEPAAPAAGKAPATEAEERELLQGYLEEARRLARELEPAFREARLATTERDLIPFLYCRR